MGDGEPGTHPHDSHPTLRWPREHTWLGQPRMEKGKRPEENQVSSTSSSEGGQRSDGVEVRIDQGSSSYKSCREREAGEKLSNLSELRAGPICLRLLPEGRLLWGRFSGGHGPAGAEKDPEK